MPQARQHQSRPQVPPPRGRTLLRPVSHSMNRRTPGAMSVTFLTASFVAIVAVVVVDSVTEASVGTVTAVAARVNLCQDDC